MSSGRAAIIVHGGAGPVRDEELSRRLEGCKKAALAGWTVLKKGGSSLDAVECAVIALENNPVFNAGIGSTLNAHGKVEMDAAIMEGRELRAGAVAAVTGIKNPIQLARRILEDGRHVLLVGDGALAFAREIGVPEYPPEQLVIEAERKRWQEKHGTVGCVGMDREGRIAAATSTGGMFGKLPGRVGDSALLGCGTYANDYGGISCTGHGEAIIRIVMAKTAAGYLEEDVDAPMAAQMALTTLEELAGSRGGLIVLDREGRVGYARNTPHMPVCWVNGDGDALTDS